MVWKSFLWSSLSKSYSICLEISDLARFWPFKTKIWPFFCKNWLYWEFLTYNFQTQLWIFLVFGMELLWILTLSGEPIILFLVGIETTLVVLFEKIIVYMPGKFWDGQNLAIFGQNWQFWRFLASSFQTPLWIFLIFGMEVVFMVLFNKIILYMPGEFWYGEILAIYGQNFAIFWPKLTVMIVFYL